MNDKKSKRPARLRNAALALTIPISLAAGPILGYFIGQVLDKKFDSDSVFTAVAFMLGFVAGVAQTVKIIKVMSEKGG